MKLSIGKRVLIFLHCLMSLLICAAFAAYLIAPDFALRCYGAADSALGGVSLMIVGIVLLVAFAALTVAQIYMIFQRNERRDRGFITVDSSDNNRIRIAVSAVEQMVRHSVNNIDGITDMRIDIESQDDAINIGVIASIVNGSHVPTLTMGMQRAIRQFVELNCGVAVRSVSISINAVSNAQEIPRRRRGLRRAESAAPARQAEPRTQQEGAEDAALAGQVAPLEDIAASDPWGEAPAGAVSPDGAAERSAFEPDAPYESEFARDLAAMKAREGESDAAASPSVDQD